MLPYPPLSISAPKVDNTRIIANINQYILRLQMPLDDAGFMQALNSRFHLVRPLMPQIKRGVRTRTCQGPAPTVDIRKNPDDQTFFFVLH